MQLRPGVTCDQAIKALDDLVLGSLNDLQNQLPHQNDLEALGSMPQLATKYDMWTRTAARELAKVFQRGPVTARLRQGRYGHIISHKQDSYGQARLLGTELAELHDYFSNDVANELREIKERFKRHQGRTLVLDCNDLLHYQRFDKIPWTQVYGSGVVVVLPHVITDEMDAKAYNSASEKISKRARGVYRLLEQLQDEIDAQGYAELNDGATLEILSDDPGHQRLPNNDNEAVACAAYLQQALAPGQVTVITRDIGMRSRARTWKLRAEPLPEKFLIPADGLSSAELDKAVESITVSVPAPTAAPAV